MKFMKLGSKPDAFQSDGADVRCSSKERKGEYGVKLK